MSTTFSTNKAGISPIPTEKYFISTTEVIQYLQNQLHFPIYADFTRWTGITAQHSYVRMRVVINPKDIVVASNSGDYVDKILRENAAGMRFDEDAIKKLEPFMYPRTIANLKNQPDVLRRLYDYGVMGERLDDLIMYSQLTYSQDTGFFRLYLRPERIITDMLSDPDKNKIDGHFAIIGVHGLTSETIRWEVDVTKTKDVVSDSNVSIDAVFNNN